MKRKKKKEKWKKLVLEYFQVTLEFDVDLESQVKEEARFEVYRAAVHIFFLPLHSPLCMVLRLSRYMRFVYQRTEKGTLYSFWCFLFSLSLPPPLHSHCMLFRSFDGAAITRTHLYMEETGSIWHNPINRLPFFSVHRFSTLFFLMLLTPFVYFLSYIYVYFYFIDFIRGIFLISSSPLRSSGGLRLRNEWWDVEKSWMLKKFGRLAAPLFPRVFFWSRMTPAWTISLSPSILVRFSGVFWYGFLEFVTGFGESRK